MSGGLDSSVAAALCAKAVGGKKVLGFSMPESETYNVDTVRLAEQVARKFRIIFQTVDITPIVQAMGRTVKESRDKIARVPFANVKARLRMVVLYYYANVKNGLVVGTSDKSELMLGYFTKYGDGGCDIEPLGDLYKTSLKQVGEYLGLPRTVLLKPPSPELWPGQTAEKELGGNYEKIDLVLWGLERWLDVKEISEILKVPIRFVENIRKRYLSSEHKRRPPMLMKMGFRTPGQDLRIPYSA
jgi:NAD+ synthase